MGLPSFNLSVCYFLKVHPQKKKWSSYIWTVVFQVGNEKKHFVCLQKGSLALMPSQIIDQIPELFGEWKPSIRRQTDTDKRRSGTADFQRQGKTNF